jgi:hypothetical protein
VSEWDQLRHCGIDLGEREFGSDEPRVRPVSANAVGEHAQGCIHAVGGAASDAWDEQSHGADPSNVSKREYVFAVPLDVMGRLARELTEVYERRTTR